VDLQRSTFADYLQHDVDAIIIVDGKELCVLSTLLRKSSLAERKKASRVNHSAFLWCRAKKRRLTLFAKVENSGSGNAHRGNGVGQGTGVPVSIRDITERKRMEEELRQSEDGQRRSTGHPIPTYTWRKVDGNFVLTDYNKAAEEIIQGKMSDLLGKKCRGCIS